MFCAGIAIVALCITLFLILYLALYLLSPCPRAAYASENQYRSVDNLDELRSIDNPEDASISFSLIIPAYNEKSRLPSMIKEALAHLEERKLQRLRDGLSSDYEVLLVDDGSTDATARVALDLAQELRARGGGNIRVIRMDENRGKGGAVTHGMRLARGERILFADADGASRFADLDLLEAALNQNLTKSGHGLALGSRAHLVDTAAVVQRSAIRNLLMKSFHFYLHILVGDLLKDTQCGFKLFARPSAQLIYPRMHVEGWAFDIEMLLLARFTGIPMIEVPITWSEVDGSKMNLVADSIKMAIDLLVIRANYALHRWQASTQI